MGDGCHDNGGGIIKKRGFFFCNVIIEVGKVGEKVGGSIMMVPGCSWVAMTIMVDVIKEKENSSVSKTKPGEKAGGITVMLSHCCWVFMTTMVGINRGKRIL